MRGSDGDGSPRYSTSKKNIGIAETCHAISPGDLPPIPEKSAYVLQSCPPGVTESFELSVDEMMGDIPGEASPSEAIDILRQRMEDLGCYGNILGEGGGVNTQLCN